MEKYIGTKQVIGAPMNRADYNQYRGWQLPPNENGADDGYLVEYVDGGPANDPRHIGYISWSPKDVFEGSCRPVDGLTFGLALEALKLGKQVARAGWNGKGMWLSLVNAGQWKIAEEVPGMGDPSLLTLPWIGMKTADSRFVPWLASQTDMLAEDWLIVE